MKLQYRGKEYSAKTAAAIVDAIKLDEPDEKDHERSLKAFIAISLLRMDSKIPLRELEVSSDLPDEEVAFNYLCLLESYDGGKLIA